MNGRRGETVYQILCAQAEDTPDAIAIASLDHEPITYSRLLNLIDLMIKSLNRIGIGRNNRVAIVMPSHFEMAITSLGVSCAAVSVPFNPSYGETELACYLSDLNATALIAHSNVESPAVSAAVRHAIPIIEFVSAPNTGSRIFALNSPTSFGSSSQDHLAEPDDLALILETSGTTSKPKRVPLTHRNLCTSALFIRDTLKLTSADRCLNVTPLFHIHGLIGALLSSLAAGSTFIATPSFDSNCFFGWMKETKPTWYTAVPTIHQAILSRAREHVDTTEESRLRFIRSSSAALPPKIMAKLETIFKVPVIEAYGMTEAAHQITSNPLPPLERKAGSVGVAVHTEVAIMDEAGNLLTAGEKGEIVIRGPNVTRGYEGNDEDNETAFANGWFRTGDQGYLDDDGYLFLTGRLKEIINKGGEKISPCEIEEALLAHPDVLQAVTFPIPHPSLGEDVGAAVWYRSRR